MTSEGPAPDLLASGDDDDPFEVTRRRRRWGRVAALAAGAVLVVVLLSGRLGVSLTDVTDEPSRLAEEPADSLVVLSPDTESSARVEVPQGPHVMTVECVGEGTILARLDGESFVQMRCSAGHPATASRALRVGPSGSGLVDGQVIVSVSTVSTTDRTEWRVSLHPA